MAMRLQVRSTLVERFWAKLGRDKRTPGCWIWQGEITSGGYGRFTVAAIGVYAHRASYEILVGPIPAGLSIDHLCRVRRCVNPAHLEPVTMQENILRGESMAAKAAALDHCKYGHPYDEANTYIYGPRNYRRCRTCHRQKVGRARKRRTDGG